MVVVFLVSVLSSRAPNDSSDKASTAPLGTLFHSPIHLTVRIFARRFSEKIPLAIPSQLQPCLLHYVISLTCFMSMLWYVILSPLPSQTLHLATQIFLHKSTPPDSLDHFCCSSLNCLQFISLFSKQRCLEMNEAKTTTCCFTSPTDINKQEQLQPAGQLRQKKTVK